MRSHLTIKASDGISAVTMVIGGGQPTGGRCESGYSTAYSVDFPLLFIRFRSQGTEKAIDGGKVLDILCAKGS